MEFSYFSSHIPPVPSYLLASNQSKSPENEAILSAAASGDVSKLKESYDRGANSNYFSSSESEQKVKDHLLTQLSLFVFFHFIMTCFEDSTTYGSRRRTSRLC